MELPSFLYGGATRQNLWINVSHNNSSVNISVKTLVVAPANIYLKDIEPDFCKNFRLKTDSSIISATSSSLLIFSQRRCKTLFLIAVGAGPVSGMKIRCVGSKSISRHMKSLQFFGADAKSLSLFK